MVAYKTKELITKDRQLSRQTFLVLFVPNFISSLIDIGKLNTKYLGGWKSYSISPNLSFKHFKVLSGFISVLKSHLPVEKENILSYLLAKICCVGSDSPREARLLKLRVPRSNQ